MNKQVSLVTSQLSALVRSSDIREAQKLLANIADEKGDRAVSVLLEKLPIVDVLAIVREGDMGSSSALHGLIAPKRFGEMIRLESQHGVSASMIESKATGMISAIVFGDNIDPGVVPADFIRAMFETEEGTRELMKFLLLDGGAADNQSVRSDQILHFMQFGDFDLTAEEPKDPEDSEDPDPQELNGFPFFSGTLDDCQEHHDMSWRHVVAIIVTEMDEEKNFLLHALHDYKNKLSAPKASIPIEKTVTVASGQEVESAL